MKHADDSKDLFLDEVNILWKEMRAEVYAVQAWAQEEPDSDLRKRAFIRSMSSFIEACISSLSEAVVMQSVGLSAAEYAILGEKQFDLLEDGTVNERPRFYPAAARWRLLVRVMERRIGTKHWLVNFQDKQYDHFKELIRIRNRITHPKAASNMKIENGEMEKCISGFTWFIKNYQSICKVDGCL